MWPARRSQAEALTAYWQALVREASAEELARLAKPIDPKLLATLDHVRASRTEPRPDPVFVARLEEDLMHAFTASVPGTVPLRPVRLGPPNGRAASPAPRHRPPVLPAPSQGRRWMVAHFATAALVLFTIAVGYVAFGSGWPMVDETTLTPVPAVFATPEATPEAGMTSQTLFEATFSPAELPAGDREATLYRVTLPPGTRMAYLAGPFCGCGYESIVPGVGIEVVQSGSYGVRLQAPMRVRRSGAATEETIPAGSEVRLGAGDVVIYPDYAARGEMRAEGDVPTVIVGLAIRAAEPSGTPVPGLAPEIKTESLADLSAMRWTAIVGNGPATVTLRRLVLPSGAIVPPYAPTGSEAGVMEAGHVKIGIIPSGESEPSRPLLDFPAGKYVPFLPASPGARRTIESIGDEPSVLLMVTVAAAGGPATPTP